MERVRRLTIVNPEGEQVEGTHRTPAPFERDGGAFRLGVVENSNANARFILEAIGEGVLRAFGGGEIVWVTKPTAAAPASPAELDGLVEGCSLVLAGTAD